MDNKLTKSLTDLIDETLMELDELRKSRFAASEIHIAGPGEDGIADKPTNGDLHAKKAEHKDDDKDEDKDDKDMDKGENNKADPDGGHHKAPVPGMEHGQGPREQSGGGKTRSGEGKNSEADPGETHWTETSKSEKDEKEKDEDKKKKDKDAKGGEEHEAEERKAIGKLADLADMKKSLSASESLMKSYVEERVKPLEDKLSTILDLVNKIADQPVAPKGATARTAPLLKSADEGAEPLSKSQVANKLLELKKSGTQVDSLDIVKAETGQDLRTIIKKYEIS